MRHRLPVASPSQQVHRGGSSLGAACWGKEGVGGGHYYRCLPQHVCFHRLSFLSALLGPVSSAAHTKEVTLRSLVAGTLLLDLGTTVYPQDRGIVVRTCLTLPRLTPAAQLNVSAGGVGPKYRWKNPYVTSVMPKQQAREAVQASSYSPWSKGSLRSL